MDFILSLEQLSYAAGILVLIITGVAFIVKKIYSKGRKDGVDESCADRIESELKSISIKLDNLSDLGKQVESLTSKIDNHIVDDDRRFDDITDKLDREILDATESHRKIHVRLNGQDIVLAKIEGIVSIIKEKILR